MLAYLRGRGVEGVMGGVRQGRAAAPDTGSAAAPIGSLRPLGSLGTFRALCPIGTFRALCPIGTFRALCPIGTFRAVRPIGAFWAVRPGRTLANVLPLAQNGAIRRDALLGAHAYPTAIRISNLAAGPFALLARNGVDGHAPLLARAGTVSGPAADIAVLDLDAVLAHLVGRAGTGLVVIDASVAPVLEAIRPNVV
jgi:hypothetical protein